MAEIAAKHKLQTTPPKSNVSYTALGNTSLGNTTLNNTEKQVNTNPAPGATGGLEEYYTVDGVLIGKGEPNNNKKFMVLNNSVAKQIKNQIKANGQVDKDFVNEAVKVIPSIKLVKNFEEAFTKIEKPEDKNRKPQYHEEALAAGTNAKGEEDVQFSTPGKEAYLPKVAHADYTEAARKLLDNKYKVNLVAHTHPWQITENQNHTGPDASKEGEFPDLTSAANDELGEIDRVVLGYEVITTINPNIAYGQNTTYSQGDRMVTYYTKGNVNIGSIMFDKLQKLSETVYGK